MQENRRILFVDDDEMVLACFERLLRHSFHIDTALGPARGVHALMSTGPYAVVVSDMRMPGMSGIDLLAKMKLISPSSVGVLLSGNTYTEDVDAALRDGTVFCVVQKPCPTEEIVETLHNALLRYEGLTKV